MDRDSPGNADEDKGDVPLWVWNFAEEAFVEQVSTDVEVEQEVSVEYDYVPGEHGDWPVEFTDEGEHVPDAVGTAEVDNDKHDAHDD